MWGLYIHILNLCLMVLLEIWKASWWTIIDDIVVDA
jgi:hypothetical protein